MEMPSSGSVLPVYPDHWKSPTANVNLTLSRGRTPLN